MQTDPEPLRINTTGISATATTANSNWSSALDTDTPLTDDYLPPPAPNPVFMGRMFDYFSNPGYQLGDSLLSSYHFYYQQPIYEDEVFYKDNVSWKGEVREIPQQTRRMK
jgi:hypothetical protein